MIIFDLDGTLADCEHRRHFVEPEKDPDVVHGVLPSERKGGLMFLVDYHKSTGKRWHPHFQKFYEACDLDKPIESTIISLRRHSQHDRVQIWSGRCESVREKTIEWFDKHISGFAPKSWFENNLKMRPVGDNTPDEALKEKWLDEYLYRNIPEIECLPQMVFDSNMKSVKMWRRRGIFVFDCNQTGKIF